MLSMDALCFFLCFYNMLGGYTFSWQLCFLQVRSLRAPYPLIQTVVLRNARHLLLSNNAAIVALDNAVYGLFPVPLGAQVFPMLLLMVSCSLDGSPPLGSG